MKVIFLDIDGVLNYQGSAWLDSFCLENLKRIISTTNAKIVLISTWRIMFLHPELSNKPEKNELLDKFHNYNLLIHDFTPDFGEQRDFEIKNWLESHDVSSFVIIDDFDYNYKQFENRWVRPCWFENGLTTMLADDAIEILMND